MGLHEECFRSKMMRIKEAIQRKKLIHEMNEEWKDYDFDLPGATPAVVLAPSPDSLTKEIKTIDEPSETALQSFVQYLSGKLNDYQKRALKVTWKRLSEAPKTSGRGTIHIMEKVLTKVCEAEPAITTIFYKSAFLSCIEDRRCGRTRCGSISTIRDHAHILVEFINSILQCLFEGTTTRDGLDPESIGAAHSRLGPLGFDRRMWHVLGECFAEVMFMQDCIRAYPHAASAWSLVAVAMTDKMYAAGKPYSQSKSSLARLSRGRSVDAVRPRASVSRTSHESQSSDEVFVTARENFDSSPRLRPQECPYARRLNMSEPVGSSCGSSPKRTLGTSCTSVSFPAYSPSMRETAIEPPTAYSNRAHPIRIPRVKMSRSLSEVRVGNRRGRITNV